MHFGLLENTWLVPLMLKHDVCAQLEQERAEQKSRQAQMREAMMGLEEQVSTLGRKLAATKGELSCLKNECSMLRLAHTMLQYNTIYNCFFTLKTFLKVVSPNTSVGIGWLFQKCLNMQ